MRGVPEQERRLILDRTGGRLRMTRRFGRPANLEPQERVLLFVERIRGGGQRGDPERRGSERFHRLVLG